MESSIFAEGDMTSMTVPNHRVLVTKNMLQEYLNISRQEDRSRDRHAKSSTRGDDGRGYHG